MAKAKKLPSGMWRTLVYTGKDAAGKRQYKSFTASTRRQSEFLAAEYVASNRVTSAEDLTLCKAMERYIESKSVLSPATIAGYKSIQRTYFKAIQSVKLKDLTQEMVQREVSALAANHSPKTVRNAHGFLSAVLDMFLPSFRLSTFLPQKQAKERSIPTESEFKTFLESIRGKPIEVPVLLAALGSLRRSEIAALTDDDVLDIGVRVNKAMVRGADNEWHIKQPKTAASNRVAPLPPKIIQKLKNTHLGTMDPGQISRAFERAVKESGVPPFSFHALRHYYASVLHAEGVPDKYIMQFGGWSTDTVLKSVYQHAMRDHAEKESAKVTHIFERMVDENFECNTECNTQSKKAR